MELRSLIKILSKYWVLIVGFAILGLIIAHIFAKIPRGTKVEQLFFIPPPQAGLTESQQVYYGQETARNFTDSAVAILESADFKSGISEPGQISVRKVAPQLVRISTVADDRVQAQSLLNAITTSFNQKYPLQLTPVGQNFQIVLQRPSRTVALAGGLFSGTIFAIFVISLKEYFKV